MAWIKSRLRRAQGYWALTLALVTGFTTLVGVVTLLTDRFGLRGALVFGALLMAGFFAVFLMPERAWQRLTADPEAQARTAAIQAVSGCVTASDDLRRRIMSERPDADKMAADVNEWWKDTLSVVAHHAPEYLAELGMTVSVSMRDYQGFARKQSDILGQFDVRRERLPRILEGLRTR